MQAQLQTAAQHKARPSQRTAERLGEHGLDNARWRAQLSKLRSIHLVY
jgi:hypothetical protein